jgi:hypothetical protein
MLRSAHPRQLSCTWLPEHPDFPRPAGDPATWDDTDPIAAFYRGADWLRDAIACLEQGDVPKANPNSEKLMRFLFQFATPEHQLFPIELIDYSGELLDPAMTNEALARNVREHMKAVDGLLVLAEAPASGCEMEPLAVEVGKLAQAFALLSHEAHSGPALDKPVALLINKWDRREPLEFRHLEHAQKALQQFLDSMPEPPHRALVDTLRNSVAEDNFLLLPVSALGETVTRPDGHEVPKRVHPLRSFALEDGFIAVAQRCDEIELAQYQADIAQLSPWRFWQSVGVRSPWRLRGIGRRLVERLPVASALRPQAEQAMQRAMSMIVRQACSMVASVLVLLLMGEMTYDGVQGKTHLAKLRDPQATEQQVALATSWLEAYATAPLYRHVGSRLLALSHIVGLSQGKAQNTVEAFKTQREDKLYQQIQAEQDPLQQERLARVYVESHGANGRYFDQIEPIIQKIEQERHLQKNREHLVALIARVPLLRQGQESFASKRKALGELQQQAGQLPYPESVTPAISDQQAEVRRIVGKALVEVGDEENKARQDAETIASVKLYHELMQQREIVKAWEHLQQMLASSPEQSRLLDDLKARIAPLLREKVLALLSSAPRDWARAREVIDEVRNARALSMTLTDEQQQALNKIRYEIDEREDQALYDDVVRRKDRPTTGIYLQQAPGQKMKLYVQKYQEYLDKRAAPLTLTLEVAAVEWGNTWYNKNNLIILEFNEKKILERSNVMSEPNTSRLHSGIISEPFTTKMSEPVRLKMRIVSKARNILESDGDAGKGTYDRKVEELNGYRMSLDANGHKNVVVFRVLGLPVEPSLPAWGTP